MRVVLFYHSLVSDWNHGNAHFLRGFATELICRGHAVEIREPANNWSRANLIREHGENPLREFASFYPVLRSREYFEETLDLERELDGAGLVIVHEWNSHSLIERIGRHKAAGGRYCLLFHDTHHRSVTDPGSMAAYRLEHYDGVLAFGESVREIYLERGWANRAWTWHEAADTRVFRPAPSSQREGDLVWIGNWGDNERSTELREYLIEPVRKLGLRAVVYGVRYPAEARAELQAAGIEYRGWLPNYRVPQTFARFRATVHIPRRPYADALPGIPTIRPFEAMACGIPLASAPWRDVEGLFEAGRDYLLARDGGEMTEALRRLKADESLSGRIAAGGLQRVLSRHTVAHRVDELLRIVEQTQIAATAAASTKIDRP
jgi:spore maturation protein CgeB